MIRRQPDAAALLALALFAVLRGELDPRAGRTQFHFAPALHGAAVHAAGRAAEWIQRLEQRLSSSGESRPAIKEQRRRVRTATRIAS